MDLGGGTPLGPLGHARRGPAEPFTQAPQEQGPSVTAVLGDTVGNLVRPAQP